MVQPTTISPKMLLAIYAAIPVAIVVVLFDALVLSGQLRRALPTDPNTFLIFTVFFTLPHILASFFSFIDREYIAHYKAKLVFGTRLVVLASVFLPIISVRLTLYVYAIFTMIHVFFQQSGVSKSLMRGANRWHSYWQWVGVVISTAIYFSIYSQFEFALLKQAAFYPVILGLVVIYSLLGWMAVKAAKTDIGRTYFWSTHSLPILGLLFVYLGYPILTIALPRVIHDLSAFAYYLTHDHNRATHTKSNLLYRYTSALGLPVIVVSPILAIMAAYLLQGIGFYSSVFLLMLLSLMHYYIESFVWKTGTPHRRELVVTA